MAKSFHNLKTRLGLYDFLTFGKYKGCRVDSIRDMDIEYLQYLKYNKIVIFDKAVIESMANKYAADNIDIEYDDEEEKVLKEIFFDDIPF